MAGLGWVFGAQAQRPCPDWFHFQTRHYSLLREYGPTGISLLTIHSISSILFTVVYNVQVNVKKLSVSKSAYPTTSMSQEQQITPVPGPTVYKDEQEMLNGNEGSAIVLHPQLGVPDI